MLVHRKKKEIYKIQAPLTSLIDMVFMLLIYFLLTTNFMVDEGIGIKLPHAQAAAPQTQQELTVFVDRDGRAYIRNKEVPDSKLFSRIKELLGKSDNKVVIVKADRAVMLNKAVRVMDLAKAAGAQRLCLATEKEL